MKARKNEEEIGRSGLLNQRRNRPRKRFGQHFLTQPNIAQRIVAQARLSGREAVLEIGPGRGALTRLLATAASQLTAIEIDRDLSQRLREEFATQPAVRVIEGDVLDLDLRALFGSAAPVTVVANLPYNISTPVLMKLLQTPYLFRRLVLTLQLEVAARLCASPATKAYGALSVVVQLVAEPRIAFTVPPAAFFPRPKVESAVVVLDPFRPPQVDEAERRSVRHVVRTSFSRRRKQLSNVIASLTRHPHDLLRELGIDPRRRPETLTPQDFLRLAQALRVDKEDE